MLFVCSPPGMSRPWQSLACCLAHLRVCLVIWFFTCLRLAADSASSFAGMAAMCVAACSQIALLLHAHRPCDLTTFQSQHRLAETSHPSSRSCLRSLRITRHYPMSRRTTGGIWLLRRDSQYTTRSRKTGSYHKANMTTSSMSWMCPSSVACYLQKSWRSPR